MLSWYVGVMLTISPLILTCRLLIGFELLCHECLQNVALVQGYLVMWWVICYSLQAYGYTCHKLSSSSDVSTLTSLYFRESRTIANYGSFIKIQNHNIFSIRVRTWLKHLRTRWDIVKQTDVWSHANTDYYRPEVSSVFGWVRVRVTLVNHCLRLIAVSWLWTLSEMEAGLLQKQFT